jgi:hypothetical protein
MWQSGSAHKWVPLSERNYRGLNGRKVSGSSARPVNESLPTEGSYLALIPTGATARYNAVVFLGILSRSNWP